MKKILLVLAGVVFATPFFVSAQALTDQFGQNTQIQSSCVNLQNNMSYRSRDAQTNGDVSALQDFLVSQGYLSSEPTGYFGLQTVAAVKKLQTALGIGNTTTPGFGGVGPLTRSKINAMSCSSDTTPGTNTTTTTVTAGVTVTSGLPAGCTSSKGFSVTTGKSCYVAVVTPVLSSLPKGCTSTTGFSSVTGVSCGGTTQLLIPRVASIISSGNAVGEVAKITVNGSNFSSTSVLAYTNTATNFSGKLTNPNSWSGTQLVFYVDKYIGNVSGNYRAQVINIKGSSTQSSNEVDFVVPPILPAGCTSLSGYSSVDGNNCGGEVVSVPVINDVSSKGGSSGELFATTNGFINGTGLKGSLTINVGGRLVYVNSNSDTVVTFAVPAFPMYPAEGVDVVVTKGSLKSNVYKVTVALLYPVGCTSNAGFSSIDGSSCSGETAQAPSVTFSANPSSVTSGQSVLLSWGSSNATSCISSGDGSSWGWPSTRYVSGSQYTPALTTAQTYTMSCSGAGGTTSKSVTVSVTTTTTTSSIPTATVIGNPTLQLSYDSTSKESALDATYVVKISASTGSNLKLYKNGAFDSDTSAFMVTLNNAKNANGAQTNPSYNMVSGDATDNGTYWLIKNGQSATFNLNAILPNPSILFAGSYSTTLSMYKPAGGASPVTIIGSSTTNSTTIIGEISPYISSVSQDSTGTIVVYGARLNLTNNVVAIDGTEQKGLPDTVTATKLTFKPSTYGLTSGAHNIQITNPQTGNSNKVSYQVYVAATLPTIEFISNPTLSLQYDSAGGEANLVGKATVKITTGASTVYLSNLGNMFVLNSSDRPGVPVQLNLGTVAVNSTPSTQTLSPNTTTTVDFTRTFPAKALFAGSYSLLPGTVYYTTTSGSGTSTKFDGPVSNSVTVIGEKSPYITSATIGSTGNVEVIAYRLAFANNTVSFGGGTAVLSATPSGSLWIMNFKPSQFGVIAPGSYTLQISTGEGASNVVGVNVSAPVAVAPVSTQSASIIGAFAKPATPTPTVTPKWSYNWTRNLELGSVFSDDVTALQTALVKEGLYSGEVTGGFYAQTYQAVKAFQMEHGIESTGFVGPQTREKLNELYK